jgi:hypothetical protein
MKGDKRPANKSVDTYVSPVADAGETRVTLDVRPEREADHDRGWTSCKHIDRRPRMSYSDYLAGLRDGFAVGFNAGYRKGVQEGASAAYLSGYKAGYDDASRGLPYRPKERLLDYRSTLPDPLPLPKFEPLPLPKFEPLPLQPKYDFTPKLDLRPKIDPIPKWEPPPLPKLDLGPKPLDPLRPFGRRKEPWEL